MSGSSGIGYGSPRVQMEVKDVDVPAIVARATAEAARALCCRAEDVVVDLTFVARPAVWSDRGISMWEADVTCWEKEGD